MQAADCCGSFGVGFIVLQKLEIDPPFGEALTTVSLRKVPSGISETPGRDQSEVGQQNIHPSVMLISYFQSDVHST